MPPDEITRKGKIARLPFAVRCELNHRLRENEPGPVILAWVNALPETHAVLDKWFAEQPITPQNLTDWRQGGYIDWLRKPENLERTRELSNYAFELGKASGSTLTDGGAAIAGGMLLSALESASESDPESLQNLIKCLSLLRLTDLEKTKIEIKQKQLDQRDQVIDLAKKTFQRKSCELFLKWYEEKQAREVIEGRGSNSEKIDKLGQLMFGEDWK